MRYCKFRFRKKYLSPFPFNVIKNLLSIGIPTAGENLAWNVGQLMILSMVNALGTSYIASRTYLMLVATFVMTFSISLGQGTAIQVGQLVGAHEPEEAYKKCFKSLKLSIILAFIVTSIVVLFKRNIMGIFTTDPTILEISLKVFPLMIILEVGRVFNIVIINSLHAAGDIKFPMFMGIILLLGFVETTIEDGKKSSYSSNRSSYSYTKSTSSYTSGSSASKTTSSSSKSGSSSSKTGGSSSTSKVSSSGSTSTTATKSSGSKSTSTKSTKSSSTKSSSKKKYYDSYDDGYDDIYMDGDYDYDRYNKDSDYADGVDDAMDEFGW